VNDFKYWFEIQFVNLVADVNQEKIIPFKNSESALDIISYLSEFEVLEGILLQLINGLARQSSSLFLKCITFNTHKQHFYWIGWRSIAG
jgi:hypothetical protein